MSKAKSLVLVTGGARGIGQAVCRFYASQGWEVLAPGREVLDVGNADSIRSFFSDFHRPLSALVNNAGVNPINLIENTQDGDLELTLAVNLMGPLRMLREAYPWLILAEGTKHVVNISSIWAGVAKPGRAAYSSAKTGLVGLTRSAALEWAPKGILVNAVAPGFTLTELTLQNNTKEALEGIEKQIPLGRLAQPEEIAQVVYQLGSAGNSYITGQTLFVDGGYTCQ